jgi:hypothetical protein
MYADWLARRTSIYFGFIDGFTLSLVFLPHSRAAFAIGLSLIIPASNMRFDKFWACLVNGLE